MMTPRLAWSSCLSALLVLGALASVARADTVYLKDGRVLTGRVIDRGDDTVFLERALGGIPLRRVDILRIELDSGPAEEPLPHDLVVLQDGKVVRGDVRISPDGAEVIVSDGERGEVRHPRHTVSAIHWRDGRKEGGAPAAGNDPLHARIDRLLADLGKVDAEGAPDLQARASARSELLGLGLFAKGYLASLAETRPDEVKPILADLERMDAIRRVLPGALEQRYPRLVEQLIAPEAAEREEVLRTLVMEEPAEVTALLLHLVKNDESPRIRALGVSQLASLRRFEALAEVLKLPDGPLRLAAAFALGDAGIYAGVPVLIEALRIDDLAIRSAAAEKLRQYTRQHFGFLPDAPAAEREAAIAKWDAWWAANGLDLVRRSIRQAAPGLEGARVSEEEAAQARARWDEANRLLAAADRGLDRPGAPATPEEARERGLRLERAQDLLRQALELDPSLSSARMTRAVLLYEDLSRHLEARQELNRLIERAKHDPGDPDAARKFANFHLGRIAMREEDWERAALRFTQSLQYDAQFVDAMIGQGDAYLGQAFSRELAKQKERRAQTFDSARRAFENALAALAKQQEGLVDTVQELQRMPGKGFEESDVIQSVRRSQRVIASRQAEVHFRIGRIHAAVGQDELALRAYREAKKLDPDNADYGEAVRLWEQLVQ